jgi:hypothetical protein
MIQNNYIRRIKKKHRVKINHKGKSYRGTFMNELDALRYATGILAGHGLPVDRQPIKL